jgi:uracil-DNA glycosylase family 4
VGATTPAGAAGGEGNTSSRAYARQAVETDRLLGVADVWVRQSPPVHAEVAVASPSPAPAPSLASVSVVTLPGGASVKERLDALRSTHDRECPHCTAATGHTQTVFGEGDPSARLVFVGEAPGETEDQLGRPFVGRAGQKLDEMIRAMGLSRPDVYIANVLKSRPPDNRTPLPGEVERCAPYLAAQLRLIRPQVIVSLGGPATKFLLGVDTGITKLRGQWSQWVPPGEPQDAAIAVMPTYHPAYLLRNYTPKTRGEVWSDLKKVIERLQGA